MVNTQYNVQCWRVLACIPNLLAGKSKDDKQSNQSELNRHNFQEVLKIARSSLTEYYQEGGVWWIDENGDHILLKPIIFMILGDSVGSNKLVGQYNVYTARCLAKDCRCKQSQIVRGLRNVDGHWLGNCELANLLLKFLSSMTVAI